MESLMVVTAHPDDEAFGSAGILHRMARQGGRAALVCATRGDAGEIADPSLATPETLGAVREQELRNACAIMGVQDLTLLGYADGQVANVDMDDAVRRVIREIRRFRPRVVVTFEPNGGYGHPDHMAVHRITLAAARQAGDLDAYSEQVRDGLEPFQPERVLGFAFPRSLMQSVQDATRDKTGEAFRPGGDAATIPLDQMGTPDEELAYRIVLDPEELERKQRVLHAHRTQMAPGNPITDGDSDIASRWLGTETFSQLAPPRPTGALVETDIFAGLSSAGHEPGKRQ